MLHSFKKIFLMGCVLLTGIFAGAQTIKWVSDGKSYYSQSNGDLTKIDLPGFTTNVMVKAAQLTPQGQSKPLTVKDFKISSDGKLALIYTNSKRVWRRETRGDYWILNLESNSLKQLGKSLPESSLMFAKISPDNKSVAYVSKHNIYVEDIATNTIRQLTTDGTDRLINGTFDWVYEEEFDCRDGFRWSDDSKSIAYWQIDARQIRNFYMINNTDSVYSYIIPVEYPKVGEDPSPCKVGVVNVATAKTTWMDVPGDSRQHYIPRMEWAANSSEIVLEQLNRKQNQSKVFICNAQTGVASQVYTETSNAWIDVKHRWSDDPEGWEWINNGKEFLWVSEKDGWRHLYRISRDGKKETLITKGNYDMMTLKAIDEKGGFAYFLASPDNPIQQYLYRVNLNGKGKLEKVSPASQQGTHTYNVSPNGAYAFHSFSNHIGAGLTEWVSLPKHESVKEVSNRLTYVDPRHPRLFRITTEDGVTMDGWMILPKNFDSTKDYPVIFHVYGEPAGVQVKDAARGIGLSLYAGDAAADGYIQIAVENRGTPYPRGAEWRKSIYQKVGQLNIRDQAMACKIIRQWPFVDSTRIGVSGWSGGGSTTLSLLFKYPEYYQAGVSIAPVANRLLYDNIYEERYMGLPQEDIKPYIDGSPVNFAKNLKGKLLVIHGTGDDNVHYQGTEQLINELVKYGKQFQMFAYPNRSHSINEGEGTSAHLRKMYTDFFKTNLPPGGR
ncbi:S9 family peptidase [Polluticaenibacter yanchengensis]|uniref:DPP IV N-terminal domain-containing protein n=1 Tax=Polluticaenibacter yanchengensis TaxID=3014562 RepID=A0ABT4UNX4_9BACT|nr:DPP IV N-terminal domain-containing protein [Chitinophagaceae bacterium LY-5]